MTLTFLLRRRANHNDPLAHPASSKRGVRAIVTTREAGMRWTLSRQALLRETTDEMADGEVVWSWRPKAGAKFAKNAFAFCG